jgi:hypothetical protein
MYNQAKNRSRAGGKYKCISYWYWVFNAIFTSFFYNAFDLYIWKGRRFN